MDFARVGPPTVSLGVFALWAVIEGAVQLSGARQPDAAGRKGAALVALLFALFGSVVYGWLDTALLHWTTLDAVRDPPRWVGVALVVLGCGLRLVARGVLGRSFSGYVQTSGGHRLVTQGVYAWVQHPIYLATALLYVAIPLSLGSLGSLAIGLGVGLPALAYRMRVEEGALREWFGEEYAGYQRRTARLVPFVW